MFNTFANGKPKSNTPNAVRKRKQRLEKKLQEADEKRRIAQVQASVLTASSAYAAKVANKIVEENTKMSKAVAEENTKAAKALAEENTKIFEKLLEYERERRRDVMASPRTRISTMPSTISQQQHGELKDAVFDGWAKTDTLSNKLDERIKEQHSELQRLVTKTTGLIEKLGEQHSELKGVVTQNAKDHSELQRLVTQNAKAIGSLTSHVQRHDSQLQKHEWQLHQSASKVQRHDSQLQKHEWQLHQSASKITDIESRLKLVEEREAPAPIRLEAALTDAIPVTPVRTVVEAPEPQKLTKG